jgi:MSHA biogenesis protein MshP
MIGATRGFALPSAIFLLVILAALGAFIVNISTGQHASQALDILGERAYQAAYAGREWARYQINASSASPICPASTAWGASTFSLGFAGTETLGDFNATIECRLLESTDVEGVPTSLFEVRVTACNHAQTAEPKCPGAVTAFGYVERQIQALLSL